MHDFKVGPITIGKKSPLVFISGPCVIENKEQTLEIASELKDIFDTADVPFIFKASFDKANRSSIASFRGPGLDQGLAILEAVKNEFSIPVTTDFHLPQQAKEIALVCDLLQVPAFLCRQTDMIVAAGETKLPVSIKKGQFLSPWDMKSVTEKFFSTGNHQLLLIDRGTSFGYNNLVSDMRALPIMQSMGCPVCFDASHSTQLPGGLGSSSGGQREFIPILAKASVAAGAQAIFIESHPNPEKSKSDAHTIYPTKELLKLVLQLKRLHEVVCSE